MIDHRAPPLFASDDELPADDPYVTDREIARRWRIGVKAARVAIRALERNPTFPKKDPLFGGRRYWAAVVAFMRNRAGLTMAPVAGHGIKETFDAETPADRKRARPAMASPR